MGDSHSQSFFGQNTGLLISSSTMYNPFIFIRCIKRKPDGLWEKPSLGEGKFVKLSLEEMVSILELLKKNRSEWRTLHSYKETKTQISFNWEEKSNMSTLWINIGNYSKMLNHEQCIIFKILLDHLLNEKIIYATTTNTEEETEINGKYFTNPSKSAVNSLNDNTNFRKRTFNSPKDDRNDKHSRYKSNKKEFGGNGKENDKEVTQINGKVKGETPKALLINFNSNEQDVWIPKSTIHSNFSQNQEVMQDFLIDDWVLKRNRIIS